MKKIKSFSIEYKVYSYLDDQDLKRHYQQMLADGWSDAGWNNYNDIEYDANELEYMTIKYSKERTL